MTRRFPGSIITDMPTAPTSDAASGIWTLAEAMEHKAAGNWPEPAGDFLPTDLTNLLAWFRADLGVTGTTSVTNWADQSGNGHHLDQIDSGSNNPNLLASGGPNSQACINFDTGDNIEHNGTISFTDPVQVLLVLRPDAYTNGKNFLYMRDTAATSTYPRITGDGTDIAVHSSGGTANPSGAPTAGQWGLITAVWDSGTAVKGAWNDGVYDTAAVGSITGPTGLSLGSAFDGQDLADCAIAELIIYHNGEKTGDDLTALKTYLNTRYALWA